MVPLPFKDQQSANSVKRQMQILSANIGVQIKPVFQTKKIDQVLALKEKKPPIVSNQCDKFECDLCDADYVGCTTRPPFTLAHKRKQMFCNREASWGTWSIEDWFGWQTILTVLKKWKKKVINVLHVNDHPRVRSQSCLSKECQL